MSCSDSCKRPTQSQTHCGECHLTFAGFRGFDNHRRADACLDPYALGMVKRDEVWRDDRPRPQYWNASTRKPR